MKEILHDFRYQNPINHGGIGDFLGHAGCFTINSNSDPFKEGKGERPSHHLGKSPPGHDPNQVPVTSGRGTCLNDVLRSLTQQ